MALGALKLARLIKRHVSAFSFLFYARLSTLRLDGIRGYCPFFSPSRGNKATFGWIAYRETKQEGPARRENAITAFGRLSQMKKFALLALLLSLGTFTIGCDKKAEKVEPAPAPAADAAAPAAEAPAEAAPAEAK